MNYDSSLTSEETLDFTLSMSIIAKILLHPATPVSVPSRKVSVHFQTLFYLNSIHFQEVDCQVPFLDNKGNAIAIRKTHFFVI